MKRKMLIITISTIFIFSSAMLINIKPLHETGFNGSGSKEFDIWTSGFDFAEQIRIYVGTEPFRAYIGDANNDGYNDIVSANFYDNNVSILLWNSGISYWNPKITREAGSYPTCVIIGDSNNDGYNDIVAGNQNSNDISILLWNITTNDWVEGLTRNVGRSPYGVSIADANNDGYNDIVTSNYAGNDISIILWNATKNDWEPQKKISVGEPPGSAPWVGSIDIEVGDADHDGDNDIVVANDRPQNIMLIRWNATINDWDAPEVIYSGVTPYGVSIDDANNDGYDDIVIANRNGGFVPILIWNTTTSNWNELRLPTYPGSIFDVAIGDVNNDGYNDIVNAKITTSAANVASIHLWNASSKFWDPEIMEKVGNRPESVVIGDANNDNHNDIVTSNTFSDDVSIILYEPPWWLLQLREQRFTSETFKFTLFLVNEDEEGVNDASFQIWWNSVDVSDSLNEIGDGFYQISLEPITVAPDEDPILLNISIHKVGYDPLYYESYIAVSSGIINNEETITASIDFDPDVLNLNSNGKWVTVYIELPEPYLISDIKTESILLNGVLNIAENSPSEIVDHDNDGVPDLMVKFSKTDVQSLIGVGEKIDIIISGALDDGTNFQGIDTIKVINKSQNLSSLSSLAYLGLSTLSVPGMFLIGIAWMFTKGIKNKN
jgi:hypothetical protein